MPSRPSPSERDDSYPPEVNEYLNQGVYWHQQFVPRWIGTELRYIHTDQAVIRFNRINPHKDGLTAYVEVHHLPTETLLHAGRWDLMGSRTLSGLSNAVTKRAEKLQLSAYAWEDAIHEVVYDAIQLNLEGDPVVRLKDVDPRQQDKFLLRPLIGAVGATALIARGGSYKSAIALAAALAVCSGRTKYLNMKPETTGPVLYLDWEADAATHAERAQALALEPTDMDQLFHQYQKGRPLATGVEQIKRRVDEEGVVLCIIDSVMLARGGDANGPEANLSFFAAIAALGVPCLLVDHKSRKAIENGEMGAYGSIINENSIRLAWEIPGIHRMPDGTDQLLMVPGKRNNFGRLPRLAFEAKVQTDDQDYWTYAHFRPVNPKVAQMPEPDSSESLRQRIIELMAKGGGPYRVSDVAQKLDADAEVVRRSLNRDKETFVNLAMSGTGQWQLRNHPDTYPTPGLTSHLPPDDLPDNII